METWDETGVQELTKKARFYGPKILSTRTLNALSAHLDNILPVYNSEFQYRDFRGLADLLNFTGVSIERLEKCGEPSRKLIAEWIDSTHTCDRRLSFLLECLLKLERFDVLEEIQPCIERDIEVEEAHRLKNARAEAQLQIQYPDVSTTTTTVPNGSESCLSPEEERQRSEHVVTLNNIQFYDAFISYAFADIQFVKKLIHYLEKEKGCKLMVPDRDLLPGTAQHTVTANIIEQRCVRMVIILSNAFLESEACEFQVQFAHCLSPGSRSKRLIPVLIDDSFSRDKVPPVLRHVTMCDYTKKDLQEWFWPRLAESIKLMGEVSESDVEDRQTLRTTTYKQKSLVPIDFNDISSSPSSAPISFERVPYFSPAEISSFSSSSPMETSIAISGEHTSSSSQRTMSTSFSSSSCTEPVSSHQARASPALSQRMLSAPNLKDDEINEFVMVPRRPEAAQTAPVRPSNVGDGDRPSSRERPKTKKKNMFSKIFGKKDKKPDDDMDTA